MPQCLQQYLRSLFCHNLTNFNAANSEMYRVNTFVNFLFSFIGEKIFKRQRRSIRFPQPRPNKEAETAVHGCHCPGNMAVRMVKALARPWVGVKVCRSSWLAFIFLHILRFVFYLLTFWSYAFNVCCVFLESSSLFRWVVVEYCSHERMKRKKSMGGEI